MKCLLMSLCVLEAMGLASTVEAGIVQKRASCACTRVSWSGLIVDYMLKQVVWNDSAKLPVLRAIILLKIVCHHRRCSRVVMNINE